MDTGSAIVRFINGYRKCNLIANLVSTILWGHAVIVVTQRDYCSYIVVCHTVRYRYPPTNGGTNKMDRKSGNFRSVRFPLAPAKRAENMSPSHLFCSTHLN